MCRCNPLLGARRPRPHLTTVLVQEPNQLRFSQPARVRSEDGVGWVALPIGGAWSNNILAEWKTRKPLVFFERLHQQLLIAFVLLEEKTNRRCGISQAFPIEDRRLHGVPLQVAFCGREATFPKEVVEVGRCAGFTGCWVGATGCRVGTEPKTFSKRPRHRNKALDVTREGMAAVLLLLLFFAALVVVGVIACLRFCTLAAPGKGLPLPFSPPQGPQNLSG